MLQWGNEAKMNKITNKIMKHLMQIQLNTYKIPFWEKVVGYGLEETDKNKQTKNFGLVESKLFFSSCLSFCICMRTDKILSKDYHNSLMPLV